MDSDFNHNTQLQRHPSSNPPLSLSLSLSFIRSSCDRAHKTLDVNVRVYFSDDAHRCFYSARHNSNRVSHTHTHIQINPIFYVFPAFPWIHHDLPVFVSFSLFFALIRFHSLHLSLHLCAGINSNRSNEMNRKHAICSWYLLVIPPCNVSLLLCLFHPVVVAGAWRAFEYQFRCSWKSNDAIVAIKSSKMTKSAIAAPPRNVQMIHAAIASHANWSVRLNVHRANVATTSAK